MTVHMRLKVTGDPAKVEEFHRVMVEIDGDWPYAMINVSKQHHRTHQCKTCQGRAYDNPRLSAADIKRIAPQFGVRVKIKGYLPAYKCADSVGRCIYVDRADPTQQIAELA